MLEQFHSTSKELNMLDVKCLCVKGWELLGCVFFVRYNTARNIFAALCLFGMTRRVLQGDFFEMAAI